jgi:hypothetical protein
MRASLISCVGGFLFSFRFFSPLYYYWADTKLVALFDASATWLIKTLKATGVMR